MGILYYSSDSQMAIADDPFFPSEDEVESLSREQPPLALLEWQTYFVKFYSESVPSYFPKPGTYYNQRSFPGKVFEISFRNIVGITRIGPVSIRVEGRKISKATYEAMLDYIAEKYSNLVFSFKASVGQRYKKVRAGRDIAYIEYLFIKKYLLDGTPDLDGVAALIRANPHHRIFRESRWTSIEFNSDVRPEMLVSMFSAADRFAVLKPLHPLGHTNLGRVIRERTSQELYPTDSIEVRKHHSVDTNENRFVKYFLQSVQRRLKGLSIALRGKGDGYLNQDIEINLNELERKVRRFLSDPMWADVGVMQFLPASSQVLQRREGYRQLYRLYSLLQLATHCDYDDEDFKNLLETKDTPTLFEYWSFFVVKDILDRFRKVLSCRIIVPDAPLEQRVTPGIRIEYEGGVSLLFNWTYSGSSGMLPSAKPEESVNPNESYSHNLRPDIVLCKGHDLLIFDAKFKGQGGGFYGESEDGSISSWKDEDIDKMHTYRDAIKNVTGAFILYPGERSIIYQKHEAAGLYHGVGALPLKPEAGAQPVMRHLDDLKRVILHFTEN